MLGKTRRNPCSEVAFSPINGEQALADNDVNECKPANVRNAREFGIKFQGELWNTKEAKVHIIYKHNLITNHFSEEHVLRGMCKMVD